MNYKKTPMWAVTASPACLWALSEHIATSTSLSCIWVTETVGFLNLFIAGRLLELHSNLVWDHLQK